MVCSEFLNSDTVRTVLTQAIQSPSIHNSQPRIWKVQDDGLRLHADPKRHLRSADPDGRDLLISCGAALHHCAVALAALGWHASIRRLPDRADLSLLAVMTVQRQPADELDRMLAGAIGRRRTDRRPYSPGPVPWGDIALMGSRAARAGVMLRQIDEIPRLSAIVADAVSLRAADPDYLDELVDWGSRRTALSAEAAHSDDNGVLVALGTESDDCLARLRAGEAASLVLLSATAMGLASCLVTEPLGIAETREEVRTDVFGSNGFPQLLIRLGWPPAGAEPLPPTPRRPLDANPFAL